jgi:hypothetical protein
VSVRGTRVTEVVPVGEEFRFVCADGKTGAASFFSPRVSLTSFLSLKELSRSTGYPFITAFIAMVSNMRASRSLPMARG